MKNSREALALAETVLRQAELKMQAQLQLAIAADQRAVTLAAIFSTAAVAAVGLAVLSLDRSEPLWPLFGAGLCSGLMFVRAAFLCVQAARPSNFETPGNQPNNWWADNVEDRSLEECLRREADNYQNAITGNRLVLVKNGDRVANALWWALTAPLGGAVAALVVYLIAMVLGAA